MTADPAEEAGVDEGEGHGTESGLPMDSVEALFDQLSRLVESLKLTGEPSLAVSVSEVASKSLLIAAASRFEAEFFEMFSEVVNSLSTPAIAEFAVNQGVVRKYHTLFDWPSGNANSFYKLLGTAFKERAAQLAADDDGFAASVNEFVIIGNERNKLAHSDFAAFPLTATLGELIQRYRTARHFLPGIKHLLLTEATSTAPPEEGAQAESPPDAEPDV